MIKTKQNLIQLYLKILRLQLQNLILISRKLNHKIQDLIKRKKDKINNLKSLVQRDYDFYHKISDHLIIIHNNKEVKDNEISSGKNIKQSTILNKLPPLIKGYLRAGGMVNENFYIDKEFESIYYCVIMLTEKIVRLYLNKFYINMSNN